MENALADETPSLVDLVFGRAFHYAPSQCKRVTVSIYLCALNRLINDYVHLEPHEHATRSPYDHRAAAQTRSRDNRADAIKALLCTAYSGEHIQASAMSMHLHFGA